MKQEQHYQALDEWFQTPQGSRVAHAFAKEIDSLPETLMGQHLLQLGYCGLSPWLLNLRFRQKWIVSPYLKCKNSGVIADFHQLPFERGSVDCILAPLTLERSPRYKNLLDEIDRVLKPMGQVILFGVNPWSFWGLSFRWGRLSHIVAPVTSWSTSLALKRALTQRGYQQCFLDTFYFIPPCENKRMIHRLEFLNEMGKMLWPYPAGFYCLVMQKFESGVPPFKPVSAMETPFVHA